MDHRRFRFGEFEFDAASGELTRFAAAGEPAPARLPPQPARLLALLAEAGGRVVSREEIRAAVWPDVEVEFDTSLHFCIRQIRTALGDAASDARYVETLPRRGYRLLPEVRVLGPTASPATATAPNVAGAPVAAPAPRRAWRRIAWPAGLLVLVVGVALLNEALSPAADRAVLPRPAIGVMPFRPPPGWGGGDPERLTTIADGVLEALVRSGGEGLRVVGPTNTAAFDGPDAGLAELARAFELDFIVNGRFGSDEQGPRMLAELIRASDGAHVWVRRYGAFDDVDAIAEEVGREVLTRLPATP